VECGLPRPVGHAIPSRWALSAGGMPVPPVPTGLARATAIYDHYCGELTPEEGNDPRWSPDNDYGWSIFFQCQHEDRLAAYDCNSDPPANSNARGRRRWWSAPVRWVLTYIAEGNDPPLQMPPRQL
jgi:hypothetical protein